MNNIKLKDAKVLEVGCGTGTFLELAIKYKAQCFDGIDISNEMIKYAKERSKEFKNTNYTITSLENFAPQNNEKYDIILSSSFLHHLTDLEDGIINIQKMLKPNGLYIALHEKNFDLPLSWIERVDIELQGLFGYAGNNRFKFRHRLKRFVTHFHRCFISEESKTKEMKEEDFVDYQLNFDFDLSKNIATKYGKIFKYSYLCFVELFLINRPLNFHMFVMRKK